MVIWYISAKVIATKDDEITPKTVQFSTHELHLPAGQDEAFYPESVKDILAMIRNTAAAIQ